MFRRFNLAILLLALCSLVTPAIAQDAAPAAAPTTSGSNVFTMFFAPIPPAPRAVDWIGIIQIWIILLLSVVVLALIVQYYLRYRRVAIMPEETRSQLETLLNEKRYKEAIEFANGDKSYLGKVVASALNQASNGYSSMQRAIEETGDAETTKMLRPLEILNILGNVGPMLGLFGTVYGIIIAFNDLLLAGGKVDPGKLAGGISTALVTTFWGLIVAMPAVSAYALIRNMLDELTVEGLAMAEDLIKPFKPGAKKTAPAGAPAAKGPATPKPGEPA